MEQITPSKRGQPSILIILIAVAVVFAMGYQGFGWGESLKKQFNFPLVSPSSETEEIDHNATPPLPPLGVASWNVFKQYIAYAHTHDIEGIRSIAHQISATCSTRDNPAKVEECNGLMDNVYNIGMLVDPKKFTHMIADDRQVVLYTDGPSVVLLFFTIESGVPKVLSMRFCVEDETSTKCVVESKIREDKDANGWWDAVEAIFYKK